MAKRNLSAFQRGMMTTGWRRKNGLRVVVMMVACGLAGALALGDATRSGDADDMVQPDARTWQTPPALELQFRREAIAATQPDPASQAFDERFIG